MALLKVFWNFVDSVQQANIKMLAKDTAIVNRPNIAQGCRGVFFRSVLSEELDFSGILDQLKFEELRRARNEPDNTLLFRPKCAEEKSIGVLRIIKPRRFLSFAEINVDSTQANIERIGSKEVDVLLETTEFILEEVQEQMAERFQIQETFGDFNVFFFGKRAEIFSYSGSLLNAQGNLQWRNQFLDNYDKFLRGTKCAELKARAYLLYDDVIREGFILSAGIAQNSLTEGVVKFNFTLLVTGKRILGTVPTSRSGTLTLDSAGSFKQGVTDFQFFRATDGDGLPGVTDFGFKEGQSSEEIAELGEEVPGNFLFVVNNALPGETPPEDLKQQMITRSLKALDQAAVSERVEITEQSVDHDILLDFITSKELGSNTALIISGARTLEVAGLDGDQLVLLLIDNKITVADLTLKQAVAVAKSFATTNSARIGQATSSKLSSLADFFALNSKSRYTKKVSTEEQFANVLGETSSKNLYVLESADDDTLLASLITQTTALQDFDEGGVKKIIVDGAVFGFLRALVSGTQKAKQISVLQAYIGTFFLVNDPAKVSPALFDAVLSQFPDSPTLGGKSDALVFLDGLKANAIADFIPSITSIASTRFSDAISDILGSGIFAQANVLAGIAPNDLHMNEATLHQATNPSDPVAPVKSFKNATFIHSIGTYITGLAAELSGSVLPNSTDTVGGAARAGSDINSMGSVYFTQSYAASLEPRADEEASDMSFGPRNIALEMRPPLPNGDRYLVLPFANHITGQVTIAEEATSVSSGEGDSGTPISRSTSISPAPGELRLRNVGVIRIPSSFLPAILSYRNPVVYFFGAKRKTPVLMKGNTAVVTPSQVGIAASFTSSFNAFILAIAQTHFKGNPVSYGRASARTLLATFSSMGSMAASLSKDLAAEAGKVLDSIFTSLKLPEDENQAAAIQKQIPLDNYSNATLTALKNALSVVGVAVKDVFNLYLFSKSEKPMTKSLKDLQTNLVDAVVQAQGPSGQAGGNVAKDSKRTMEALCG